MAHCLRTGDLDIYFYLLPIYLPYNFTLLEYNVKGYSLILSCFILIEAQYFLE